MNCFKIFSLLLKTGRYAPGLLVSGLLLLLITYSTTTLAEGTKQLEPAGTSSHSVCQLALSVDTATDRIPFALIGCSEEYRLNIRINDFATEKIYFGLGVAYDYFDSTNIYADVRYQIKDPAGNVITGYSLRPIPAYPGEKGFIENRGRANEGPDINNSNINGYNPLVINPLMNGDYVLEFEIPYVTQTEMRIIKFIDITVANGYTPIPGRLWSKAWQLNSGSVSVHESASFASFYIYSSDSIVTRFNCNGLAGGVWTIYSNEWGCSATGSWSDRRQSIQGNATLRPQHKIFLNDPDPYVFPTGLPGELLDAGVLPFSCDTAITFSATVNKGGNIEILLDIPPLNPGSFAPEDVQLGYNVSPGYNILLPAWDGRNGYGIPLANGTQIEARINFLNGLTNIPLYDVEDNPYGFKVDIQRPSSGGGSSKLKLFWDDTRLPPDCFPTSNVINGCIYTGVEPVSGCHTWSMSDLPSWDMTTVNSWWYFSTDHPRIVPLTILFRPLSGRITAPDNICPGQLVTFRTTSIPFVPTYYWHLTCPGISLDFEKEAPDTTLVFQFTAGIPQGDVTVSVKGRNVECGDGSTAFHTSYLYDEHPPPVTGAVSACVNSTNQYLVPEYCTSVHWSLSKGEIIGSPDANPVTIRWLSTGEDTLWANSVIADCAPRLSALPILVNPSAIPGFVASGEATSCPGLPLSFTDASSLSQGSVVARIWTWGDGLIDFGNETLISHSFSDTGNYNVKLTVTTDHGCETNAIHQIRIIQYPLASFSVYRNCLSQSIELTDNSDGLDLAFWNWDFGTAPVIASGLNSMQPTAMFQSTGQFPVKMIVTNLYGCKDTVTKQVIIHNLPSAEFTNEIPCQKADVTFSDISVAADTVLTRFKWKAISLSGKEQTYEGNPAEIVFQNAENYIVNHEVIDAYGCSDSMSLIIGVKPKPESKFNYLVNVGNLQGLVQFENNSVGASDYFWDFGNGITSSQEEPLIKYDREGEYTIMLKSASTYGCSDTAYRQYYFMPDLWMPDAFSPDNDGLNDIFRPVTLRTSLAPYLLVVYNNWGQIIFSSSDQLVGWDGKFKGEFCPDGIYSYVLKYNIGKHENIEVITKKGIVMLIK